MNEQLFQVSNSEFTGEDIDKLLESIEVQETTTSETIKSAKMDAFSRIIKGVARKYKSKWVDQEDLEQELWILVMGLVDSHSLDKLEPAYVAKCCYRKAVDVYRYSRRRYEANIKLTDEEKSELCDLHPHQEGFMDKIIYEEYMNMFEKDSKEYKYIAIKLYQNGMMNESVIIELGLSPDEVCEMELNSDIMIALGYNSPHPGSWTSKKRAMRDQARVYLGY